MAKKFVKKTDKQKKIAKFPEHMKDSFDETISKYNNLGSATILGIIPPRDGTRETAHIIKTLNQMAKRRKRIEEIAAQFKYFEDVIDRLTVSKDGLY
jgi:CHASE3 domain sensor protein